LINQAKTKVDFNEPNILNGKLFDNQIKGSVGITVLYKFSDHSDIYVCHLDVDSIYPDAEACINGLTVRHLKYYANWV